MNRVDRWTELCDSIVARDDKVDTDCVGVRNGGAHEDASNDPNNAAVIRHGITSTGAERGSMPVNWRVSSTFGAVQQARQATIGGPLKWYMTTESASASRRAVRAAPLRRRAAKRRIALRIFGTSFPTPSNGRAARIGTTWHFLLTCVGGDKRLDPGAMRDYCNRRDSVAGQGASSWVMS